MFRMLDLILRGAKWCLVLTIVRLLASAFGYEFGVSRQYLRLLEWILRLGEERIERCESEQRLSEIDELEMENSNTAKPPRESNVQSSDSQIKRPKRLDLHDGDSRVQEWTSPSPPTQAGSESAGEPTRQEARTRRVGISFSTDECNQATTPGPERGDGQQQLNQSHRSSTLSNTSVERSEQRRRRVSTPNGPPIFLFDDDDDEDADEVKDAFHENGLATPASPTESRHLGQHEFHLEDVGRLVVRGIAAIIDDEVTKRFTREQLKTWNLLTRTNAKNYQFMSRSLGCCWFVGLIIRYAILMPLRIMFTLAGFLWLITTMPLVGLLPKLVRDKPYRLVSLMAFRMLSCGINSRLKFHNREYRACGGSICVANHTSPLDVVLLASDNCYTLVGQRHGGLLGTLQFALSRAANHIWFERNEMRDRQLVAKRLREHVDISSNLPILIFPEGTCINNSAVMMFRKGSFEVTDRIYPVAIKYDARFGDPFWNSSKQSYLQYLLMIMSTWAIKCEVWYLKPMDRLQGECSAEFANRVKAEIAKQAGLENLAWDGQLKRSSVKPTWLFQQQEDYVRRLKLE